MLDITCRQQDNRLIKRPCCPSLTYLVLNFFEKVANHAILPNSMSRQKLVLTNKIKQILAFFSACFPAESAVANKINADQNELFAIIEQANSTATYLSIIAWEKWAENFKNSLRAVFIAPAMCAVSPERPSSSATRFYTACSSTLAWIKTKVQKMTHKLFF